MVLARDMAFARCKIQSRDVVSTVSILKLDGPGTSRQSNQLMTKADAHDWNLRRIHELAEMVDCILTMGRITRSVADENAVEVVGYFVDWVVVWKGCDACASAD